MSLDPCTYALVLVLKLSVHKHGRQLPSQASAAIFKMIIHLYLATDLCLSGMDHSIDVCSPSTSINCKELNIQKSQVESKVSTRGAQIRLVSQHPEVYEPCDDSFVLVDALLSDRANLLEHRPTMCLEVGCGSGYVITSLALILGADVSGLHYFATDINPHAVRTTRATLEAHGVHAEIISTDIASGLEKRLSGMMDVIVVNPPYVPTPEDEVGGAGITASWAGGEKGRRVIDRILPVVDRLLLDKGWLYMVTLTTNNPSEICFVMRKMGYASRIVLQRSTEEESLHVIKFWREGSGGDDATSESWLSHLPRWPFWRHKGSNDN